MKIKPEPLFCAEVRACDPMRLKAIQERLRYAMSSAAESSGMVGDPMIERYQKVVERFPEEPAILLNLDPIMRDVILEAVREGVPGS